ncbi:phospholipase D-like domain-containing protein [Paenibacillus abyssi]|uniref:Cardiolipin synthase n=1 Tax=Paenibacillus abyssi TaxID=1340531 RepID=A0A917G542_9BACL|nr:phosphatidylserine/phosphatidylglycerophosphate/cardiolipin synthase family protein [Paenibacillus abyssi]GGG22198.1 cardiolipin synthase [Paenibacillus abyssi]
MNTNAGKIALQDWDGKLRKAMVDFMNYLLSGGPLDKIVEGAQAAVEYADVHFPRGAAVRYRQSVGGIFTAWEQLCDLPGIGPNCLEQLAYLVDGLDLAKLDALVPDTTSNNRVEAFVNGPDNLRVLLEEIGRAKRYIHLSVMLFYNDRSGALVAEALLAALARGVKVRLMVDYGVTAFGYNKNLKVGEFGGLAEKLEKAGAKVINTFKTCYDGGEWPAKRAELAEKGVPESHLFLQDFVQEVMVLGLNVVNHRKFMIVDGVTSVIGSMNIGDQYTYETPIRETPGRFAQGRALGVPSGEEEWHDGCFRIRGACAGSLNRLFAFQWIVLGGDIFDPKDEFYAAQEDLHFGDEECTLVASFPGNPVNLIQSYYLSLLAHAGDETIIVNPYLIDEKFWEQLKSLDAEQAQHITICNPLHVNDHPTNLAAVRSHMYRPFRKGVSFYDYSKTERFAHWKITYDKRSDCVFHGSYNINERSACHDFELGVLVRGRAFADTVRGMIAHDLEVSERITEDKAFFKHPALHLTTYLNKWTKDLT